MTTKSREALNRFIGMFGYELSKTKALIRPREGYHYVPDIYGRSHKKQRDVRNDQVFYGLAQEARLDKRTLLYFDRLFTLYQAVEDIARKKGDGQPVNIMEVGVYKGGGSFFLARCVETFMPNQDVSITAIDTFTGHSAKDIPTGRDGDHTASQFNETSYQDVARYLERFPFVSVIQNRVQDAVSQLQSNRLDLLHLDVDIYEPTLFGLEFFTPEMRPGAIVIVDDYGFTSCPGARRAVDEYLEKEPASFTKFELMTGQCLLIRNA